MAESTAITNKVLVVNKENRRVIVVHIGLNVIDLSIFSFNGDFLNRKKIASPQTLTPGAVTISICEGVASLDPFKKIACIAILMPNKDEASSKWGDKINGLPFWEDVPLVDWLEIRLNREVMILNPQEFDCSENLYKKCLKHCEISFCGSFVAAFMASQYFRSIHYGEKKLCVKDSL